MTPSPTNPSVSSHSIRGVRGTAKNYQHDRLLTSHTPRGTVLAVFDGHGLVPTGHIVSELCSRRFMPLLEEQPAWRMPPSGQREQGVMQALTKVVEQLEAESDAITEHSRAFSGSTICAVILRGGWMYSVNVGDSRAVLGVGTPQGMNTVQLTRDHSVSDPRERDRIEQNGGWVANNRLNGDLEMSRTIGDTEFKRYRNQRRFNRTGKRFGAELLIATPEIEARRVGAEDVLVIVATDGLWVKGGSNDAVVMSTSGWVRARGVGEAAKRVVDMALEWGSTDNVTVVVGVLGEMPSVETRNRFREFRRRLGRRRVEKDRTVRGEHRIAGLELGGGGDGGDDGDDGDDGESAADYVDGQL